MPATFLPDISEFQREANIRAIRSQTAAIGARIAYGTTLDLCVPGRIADIRDQGFVAVLWYLFLRASQDVRAQVNTVLNVLPSLRPGECMFIDWEHNEYDNTKPTTAQMFAAVKAFETAYGQPCGVYCGPADSKAVPGGRPIWAAAYGQPEPTEPHTLWQYTNGVYHSGTYGPLNWASVGYCDTSVFHGDEHLLADAISSRPPLPAPVTSDAGDLSMASTIDFKIRMTNGKGYADVNSTSVVSAVMNSSDPGPGGPGYPDGIVLSRCVVGNITRVVAVDVWNGNFTGDIDVTALAL